MQEASMGMKFYMVFDVKERLLYISLPAEKLIVKVDPAKNPILINPVAGTGDLCRGNNPCGDEGLAIKAHLTYPKVTRGLNLAFLPFFIKKSFPLMKKKCETNLFVKNMAFPMGLSILRKYKL